jgi:hypothetical protein
MPSDCRAEHSRDLEIYRLLSSFVEAAIMIKYFLIPEMSDYIFSNKYNNGHIVLTDISEIQDHQIYDISESTNPSQAAHSCFQSSLKPTTKYQSIFMAAAKTLNIKAKKTSHHIS